MMALQFGRSPSSVNLLINANHNVFAALKIFYVCIRCGGSKSTKGFLRNGMLSAPLRYWIVRACFQNQSAADLIMVFVILLLSNPSKN